MNKYLLAVSMAMSPFSRNSFIVLGRELSNKFRSITFPASFCCTPTLIPHGSPTVTNWTSLILQLLDFDRCLTWRGQVRFKQMLRGPVLAKRRIAVAFVTACIITLNMVIQSTLLDLCKTNYHFSHIQNSLNLHKPPTPFSR